MINFLEEKYGARVSCSQVSQDGFEVGNLITRSSQKSLFSRSNGFLVEHFIKPPVDITFMFPHPIQVSFIELGLCVGAQTTDGIEILVADHQNVNGLLRSVFHRCPISQRQLKISNSSFRARPPFADLNKKSNFCPSDSRNVFKFSNLLNHVNIVRLRLTKTLGSSVPAVGSINILGIPARTCRPEELKRVLQLYQSDSKEPIEDPDIQILPSDSSSEVGKKNNVAVNMVNIPEEFLDALTFEVMSLPVLLPCGQSVDRSTLEKSSASQSSWGRTPCDPFTGIPFGPGRQPVSNAPLKARIDAFLVRNAHLDPHLASVPRVLGEKPKVFGFSETPSSSQVAHSQRLSMKISENAHHKDLHSVPERKSEVTTPKSSHERALQESLNSALDFYYKNTSPQHRTVNHNKGTDGCVGCTASNSGPRYNLPCSHTVCRTCLLGSHSCCLQCKKHFRRDQVCRTYNIP